MSTFVALGAAVGLGLVLIVRGLVPPRTDLAVALGRWEVARRHATRATAEHAGPSWGERLGRRLGDALAKRGIEIPTRLRGDLAITGRTLEAHLAALASTAAAGLVIPAAIGLFATVALGINLGFTVPVLAGIVLATAMVAATTRQVHVEAEGRRDELRRALGTYLDLVSMSLAGGRGITEALPASAAIGTGWAFDLIGDTVNSARRQGITSWEALGDLGGEYGLQELVDLSAALTLVGSSGAKVRATLGARAGTLRRRQLADARAHADQADDDMRITQIVLAMGFLILIGYPAAMNILAA